MDGSDYQNEITKLNHKIQELKDELQAQQLQSQTYKASYQQAQAQYSKQPQPRDLNPILQQLKKRNLSMKEKQDLLLPQLFPSLPEDIYYQWVAPSRLSIKRDKQWYWTIGLLLMILVTFAVIVREVMWIAVILAFFFALYVNASLPAGETIYRLTKQGIEIGQGEGLEIYSWQQLLDYSYYYKHKTEILYVDTILAFPQRIQILFSQEDRKNISMILESHLPYKPPPAKQGWILRLTEGIYIPIQDFKSLQEKIDQYYDSKYAEIIYQLKKEGRIPQNVSVDDIRKAESMQTMKLMDEIQKREEAEIKRILGI